MYFVYILQSKINKKQFYLGQTKDINKRIESHQKGITPHTKKYAPWDLKWYCVFPTRAKAMAFEKYLKSGSGTAFRNKRLI